MKEEIDKGFCIGFGRLSYRRKFIRTLWIIPLVAVLLMSVSPQSPFFEHINKVWLAVLLLVWWLAQGVYYLVRWKRDRSDSIASGITENNGESEDATEDNKTELWIERHGSVKVMALCAPVILGSAAIVTAKIFRPMDAMPLQTMADNFFADLFVIGVPLGILGLPLLLVGIYFAIQLIRMEGVHSRQASLSIMAMLLGIVACIYMVVGTIEANKQTGENSNNRLQRITDKTASR